MNSPFLNRVAKMPLLCDGAMGTVLYSKGISLGQPFEELNTTMPAVVAEVHRSYIEAGADVIKTNTFGANRIKLAAHRLDQNVGDINVAAVQLARRVVEASFKDIFIAGSVGPLGAYLAPLGRINPERAYEVYAEQIESLLGAGVDALLFETFSDLAAVEQAVCAARDLSQDIPLIVQMTFANDGLTPLGDTPQHVLRRLNALDVDIIGVNCSVGPARVLRTIQTLTPYIDKDTLISAQPNAGWPQQLEGRLMYPASPEYFAEYATKFVAAGVSLLGGCCGTTPQHIAQMRKALDTPIPAYRVTSAQSLEKTEPLAISSDPLEPTNLAKQLHQDNFITSVEIHPPRGSSVAKVMAAARMLKEAGATVVNVADLPVARMRMSPWAVCHRLQSDLGLETILNFPTRGRNLLRIQADLLAAHALNIRNLFVVMGDPTSIGDYPEAFNHHDVVSSGLIQLVKQSFNTGVDYAGKAITQPTNFLVGCALNLRPVALERELKLLKKKIDNGADFAMTQPIYEGKDLTRFVTAYENRYGPLKLPIIVSILPLYNIRHTRFLHNEIPGIVIPETFHQRMKKAGNKAEQEGLMIAKELIAAIRPQVQGIYLMPPFQRYYLAAEIIENLNEQQ
ncbi:MAG: bifunctional homocysteine S-methyltransferase/methylenetetrahydrofolate reductase [Chloroflexota bacterium]